MATIEQVVTKFLERTNQGKVNWKPIAEERTFVAIFSSAVVRISRETAGVTTLRILSKGGVEIDALSSYGSRRQELADLYLKARQAALDVDSRLDELLKYLEFESV